MLSRALDRLQPPPAGGGGSSGSGESSTTDSSLYQQIKIFCEEVDCLLADCGLSGNEDTIDSLVLDVTDDTLGAEQPRLYSVSQWKTSRMYCR
jgi:hypothetical protein